MILRDVGKPTGGRARCDPGWRPRLSTCRTARTAINLGASAPARYHVLLFRSEGEGMGDLAAAGQRLGEYVLIDRIGGGGFGEVWRAHHHAWTDQVVAIKIPFDLQ